jgi:hypothetical protein
MSRTDPRIVIWNPAGGASLSGPRSTAPKPERVTAGIVLSLVFASTVLSIFDFCLLLSSLK